MKIAVIAASGKVGRLVVEEALNRKHEVVAIVRDASKVVQAIPVIEKDIFQITSQDISEFDVVINAFGSKGADPIVYQTSTKHLINVLESSLNSTTRLIVVGGAGSLYTDSSMTQQVFETPDFPPVVYPTSSNMAKALVLLRNSSINWTFMTPAIQFDAKGPRTGNYQLGTEFVILNKSGNSYVSYADYTIALLDEVEKRNFIKKRFTVVSEN
jgi:hypothetical protein